MVSDSNLTRDEAAQRAAVVTAVHGYDVDLDLTTGPSTFQSTTTVRFAAIPGGSTFVEIAAASVTTATLNGVALALEDYDGARLTLSGLAADNELTVEADCRYSHTGEGLHRFVDPVDGEVYLYSQFETYDAHRMYACFDQPDLKAPFTLAVTTPEHWRSMSNGAVASSTAGHTQFETTKPMSPYITALIAGPYYEVSDVYSGPHGEIPLGLYCRTSLAEHLDADALFEVTKQGFDFFHRVFDYPYAFGKYDQLFVPEFNAGAMENAGAVTILEDYVFRSKVTDAKYERRAETVLHEMGHMWFGDLVTMRWWDDLWLNESFATFVSVTAQAEATRWTNAWTTFANTEKTWAYRQDQLPSTHPVSADAPDIETVKANFDGITYAKGASVLKQLVAWVGPEEFFAGLRSYFKRYEYGNTSLADLLAVLETSSGRELGSWAKEWLQTTGVNTLKPLFEVGADGNFTSFAVVQEAAAEHSTLRSHRVAVGLYDLVDEKLVRRERVELDVVGARTEVPKLVGSPRPDLVLVNDDDLTYAKIRLDPQSLAVMTDHIGGFTDSLPRTLCWSAAWDMTRDGEMAARDYATLVCHGVGAETDIGVVQSLLAKTQLAITSYGDPANVDAALTTFAATCEQLMRSAEPGSDLQLAFVSALAQSATSAEQVATIAAVLSGAEVLPGLAVDTDLRWTLLTELVARGVLGAADIDAEAARDKTSAGEKRATTARTAIPTAEAKEAAYVAVMLSPELSNHLTMASLTGFWRPSQVELTRPFVSRYVADLDELWSTRSSETAHTVTELFFPSSVVEEATVSAIDGAIAAEAGAPSGRRRLLAEGRDGLLRAVRARAVDSAAG
jgi:aminopeptidase N